MSALQFQSYAPQQIESSAWATRARSIIRFVEPRSEPTWDRVASCRTALVPNSTHGIPIKGFSASTRLVSIEQQTLLRVELHLLKVRVEQKQLLNPSPELPFEIV